MGGRRGGVREGHVLRKTEFRVRERFQNVNLLALKMEEEATSKGMWTALRSSTKLTPILPNCLQERPDLLTP